MDQTSRENRGKLKIFTAASFLNDFGSDMISPIWPLFVTSFSGVNMEVLGLIDGLGDAIVSISQAVSGWWSDKIGKRKAFVWTGYLFAATSRVGYAISSAWQWLVPFRVLDRAGKLRGAPRDAIIADFSTNRDRGGNFGFLRSFDNLGAVCGIIFAIFFAHILGYQNLFLLAAIPSVVGALLIIIAIKEPKTGARLYKGLSLKDIDPNFRLFLVLSAVFALGSFSYSFLLLFANNFGFANYEVPVLYLLFTLVASIFSLPFGRLSDRLKSRKKVLAISFALWLAVCAVCVTSKNWWAIILVFILYGLHRGAIDTVQRTFVSELAPAVWRASSLGGVQLVTGLCALPASFGAGFLWDRFGIEAPFYVSAALSLVALMLLAWVKEGNSESRIVET